MMDMMISEMIVYLTNVFSALFLFRQEKGEKKPI